MLFIIPILTFVSGLEVVQLTACSTPLSGRFDSLGLPTGECINFTTQEHGPSSLMWSCEGLDDPLLRTYPYSDVCSGEVHYTHFTGCHAVTGKENLRASCFTVSSYMRFDNCYQEQIIQPILWESGIMPLGICMNPSRMSIVEDEDYAHVVLCGEEGQEKIKLGECSPATSEFGHFWNIIHE